jgi:hypothetical protein
VRIVWVYGDLSATLYNSPLPELYGGFLYKCHVNFVLRVLVRCAKLDDLGRTLLPSYSFCLLIYFIRTIFSSTKVILIDSNKSPTRYNNFSGRPARPQTQHDCHHDSKVKPEAATAVIKLLMMGGRTPETG